LHRVKTWRLTAHGMHAGRKNFDVVTVPEQTAKKPFCDWAATNIAGADKEDAFHVSDGASERHSNVGANRSKSIWRLVRFSAADGRAGTFIIRAVDAGGTCAKEKEPGSLQVWKRLSRWGEIGLQRLADKTNGSQRPR